MIIDGKKIAEEILEEVAEEIKTLRQANGKQPRLAAILVGDHVGSRKFVELKKKASEKIGIDFRIYEYPTDITTQKLRKEIVNISKASVNHGVLIELPLPAHINTQYVLNAIQPEKDVDVLSEKSQGAFFSSRSKILPPAVEAIKMIFEKNNINLKNKNCAMFGYGLLVGKPVSHWLTQQGATVSIVNEFTLEPQLFSSNADIIISGVGPDRGKDPLRALAASNGASKPLITADMVKDRAIIVDFGKDVDFEPVAKKASLITPPVGGVGPIVIASVLKNLITLYKNKVK